MRFCRVLCACGFCAILIFTPSLAKAQQEPRELVSQMVSNEMRANQHVHYWMYQERMRKSGQLQVNEVIETPECWLQWPVSYNGNPPTPEQEQKARAALNRLVNDGGARRQNRTAIDQDSKKSDTLLKLLPDAFLFTNQGQQDGNIRLEFRPNPAFHPPSREAKVFHNMQGTITINAKEIRLVGISGKLMSDVTFGGGFLGRLHKGGTFLVEQKEVAPGDWEVSLLDVHIMGKALFFKTISEQQHQENTDFRPVPSGLSLAQAAALVEKGSNASASISDLHLLNSNDNHSEAGFVPIDRARLTWDPWLPLAWRVAGLPEFQRQQA